MAGQGRQLPGDRYGQDRPTDEGMGTLGPAAVTGEGETGTIGGSTDLCYLQSD